MSLSGREQMKRVAILMVMGVALAGCGHYGAPGLGTGVDQRIVHGAIIGGVAGGVIGGVATANVGGALIGAGLGAAAGAAIAAHIH
jgi:hypothetical protein